MFATIDSAALANVAGGGISSLTSHVHVLYPNGENVNKTKNALVTDYQACTQAVKQLSGSLDDIASNCGPDLSSTTK
ncbi:MAG TPA: hypothetical protein VGG74_16085 [Kofleriaceae bacterium]|jgi:hypothetical protein